MKRLFLLLVSFCYLVAVSAQDYPVAFPDDQSVTHATRRINTVGFDGTNIRVADNSKVYNVMLDQTLVAHPGQTVKPSIGYSEDWMNAYVYIDYNRNGLYDVLEPQEDGLLQSDNEMVSYSHYLGLDSEGKAHANGNYFGLPAFTVPADIKAGYYRMRFKVDWNCIDPAGCAEEDEDIVKNGGAIVDVRLLVTDAEDVLVNADAEHGQIVFHTGEALLNTRAKTGEDFPCLYYAEDGYLLDRIRVRHGAVSGDSLANGLPQYVDNWFEAEDFSHAMLNIPGGCMEGEVFITGFFRLLAEGESMPDKAWKLTFIDNFEQKDGSQPNAGKWERGTRKSATWARYISQDPATAFIENNELVLRCLPDPTREEGDDAMISGVVTTKGLYSFLYGRAEARMKTQRHTGNFPAFWMMPQDNSAGWPNAGEIDIFETIDTQKRAWHTVHTNWTYNLKKTNNPQSSSNESVTVQDWHVYAMEWDAEEIRWYVDGAFVFSYKKSQLQYNLQQGQWPFDHAFYLILNQSVGNGSWAAKHDSNYTYETRVDWVRVYQLEQPHVLPTGLLQVAYNNCDTDRIYDLSGRIVRNPVRGIYVKNDRKIFIK